MGKITSCRLALVVLAAGATSSYVRADRGIPWSFQPVHVTSPPHTKFDRLAHNEIDRFIFAKLQEHGVSPSAPADRLALLRRVTIDLTGLPPTTHEISSFLADRTPGAYGKVVDRLLASPAYGEYWGRHWLDVVRYGESDGYEQNHLRSNAWPYRDYVISAFNADKPFDRFVLEQLAADQVAPKDPATAPATGFLVAGIHDTVGNQTEVGTRQQRANDLDDIVTTTSATFLGLTVNCARCHDHKFDPIPQHDYYSLARVFSDIHFGESPLPVPPITEARATRVADIRSAIALTETEIHSIDSVAILKIAGGAHKRAPITANYNEDTFPATRAQYIRFTIRATIDGTQPAIDELQVFAPGAGTNLAISPGAVASASSLLPGYTQHAINHLNDGKLGNSNSWVSNEPEKGWAQIKLAEPAMVSRVVWERDREGQYHDRVASDYDISVSLDGVTWSRVSDSSDRSIAPGNIREDKILSELSPSDREHRTSLTSKLESLQLRLRFTDPPTSGYIGQFTASEPIYVLRRGDVMQRGDEMSPAALSRLAALPADMSAFAASSNTENTDAARPENQIQLTGYRPTSSGAIAPTPYNPLPTAATNPRVELARWITDPRNPLTARVIVNRLWAGHFGAGIVGTPSDFGWNGERPTHPELLDWLASDLIKNGWTLKRVQKMMVTSYTYQQSSAERPDQSAKDADDRMLWRMPLRRMEAETVRDSILSVSGKLDLTRGGPGYQLFTYRVENVSIFGIRDEQGPDTWRRGVYQIPARGIRDDLLGTLDCPDSSERTPHRTSTTTALQALCLLNGKFVNEQAEFFASRVRTEAGTDSAQQIDDAFLLAFGRKPTTSELADSETLVKRNGLIQLCRAFLNASEFIYY